MVAITAQPIDVQQAIKNVSSEEAGAVALFIGTVRNMTKGKPVDKLNFEAYDAMAISEMEKIIEQAGARWSIKKAAVIHRTGELQVSDIAVVVAASSPHRDAAFSACRYIIDTLKETVPIWKKEHFTDGSDVWVAAHP